MSSTQQFVSWSIATVLKSHRVILLYVTSTCSGRCVPRRFSSFLSVADLWYESHNVFLRSSLLYIKVRTITNWRRHRRRQRLRDFLPFTPVSLISFFNRLLSGSTLRFTAEYAIVYAYVSGRVWQQYNLQLDMLKSVVRVQCRGTAKLPIEQ